MMAFRAKGRRFYDTKVPREPNPARAETKIQWQKEPTGTMDKTVAGKIDRMIEDLGPAGAHAWDILCMVTDRPQRWSLAELWRRWSAVPSTRTTQQGKPIAPSPDDRIEALRLQLRVVDLLPLIDEWYAVNTGPSRDIAEDTAAHYRSALRGFVLDVLELERWKQVKKDATFSIELFTEEKLRVHIQEMDDVESGTVRKKGFGLRDFGAWLVGRRYLGVNPMEKVALPPQGDPLCHHVDTNEAQLLADAQPGQYRLYSAILAGSGTEVSTALKLRVRHVDTTTRMVRAGGTKSYTRDRRVRIADWAWPYVLEAIQDKTADTLLFDEIPDRWTAQAEHNDAVDALVAQGHEVFMRDDLGREHRYTMRDQRHTWAVRAVRSGWPIEAVARQLGHVNGILALKVYGRFQPTEAELDKWEKLAAARDATLDQAKKPTLERAK